MFRLASRRIIWWKLAKNDFFPLCRVSVQIPLAGQEGRGQDGRFHGRDDGAGRPRGQSRQEKVVGSGSSVSEYW